MLTTSKTSQNLKPVVLTVALTLVLWLGSKWAFNDWFDKDWECLPPALRQQIEQKTTVLQFLWKTISPEQRLDCARQWDYRHDPATEPERQRLFQFYAELNDKLQEARDKLAEWESVAAPDAGDLEKKESHIEKWRREVARLELLENSAQATTCDDTSRLALQRNLKNKPLIVPWLTC